MPRDQTVCKYCGVSYLILHEFKLLEDKLKAMEKELKFYQGSVEREKTLQEELRRLSQELEQSKTDRESGAERLQIMALSLKEKDHELELFTERFRRCEQELAVAHGQQQLFREKANKQHEKLMKTVSLLKCLQSEQAAVKYDVRLMLESFTTLKTHLSTQVEGTFKAFSTEITRLNEHLAKSLAENVSLLNQMKDLETMADSFVLTSQQLQASHQIENELKTRCHQLQQQTMDLQHQLEAVGRDFQKANKELEHYREISAMKTMEADDFLSKLRRMESDKESTETRLAKDLEDKEDTLAHLQQECKTLQEVIAEKERTEEYSRQKTQRMETELETIKEMLKQTQEEVATLQHERELKTMAYQNRIEELEVALKQRIISDDNWEAKLETELENERQKYSLRLEEIENNFKEETKMELEIERQKHEELIRKLQKQQEELKSQIPSLLSKARAELYTDINVLEKKLQDAQARLTNKDHAKESEIGNLKKMISELELRLQREQNNSRSALEDMRKDMYTKSEQLKELTQYMEELKHQLDHAKQENSFLKDTVRMECEERHELREALTQAREQLLELNQSSGTFASSNKRLIKERHPSNTSTVVRQERVPFPSSNNTSKPMSLPGDGVGDKAYKHRQSSVPSLPAIPPPHPPRNRASSLTDVKQKITAVLRSNSSQPNHQLTSRTAV
ncbi:protein LEKR1 [Spea bombifrons]|uniref:protein LEKR1 n=1 Tax=Spea bombifrons TaxID=233779 RepID=UPI00234B409E|nr:protein LEKR1 [Spea bombifrons]